MIKFIDLKFSNAFSYGENNYIRFDDATLTQLVGSNGNGKSSIALIIEEVLFNTNSKKIKKADILNRYTKAKSYSISINFEKDGVPYNVSTTRTSSTATVKFTQGNKDISSHTATGTYKSIENVLGFDHKTFSQIVYQSSVSSLEFLTATDSARKKFLIELLNLSKYTKALDVFKELASGTSKQVDTTNAKIQTITSWLSKYEKEDLTIIPLEEELPEPSGMREQVVLLSKELSNIDATNKKITQNNTYKKIFDGLDISSPVEKPDTSKLMPLKVELETIRKELKDGATLSNKPNTKTIKCPTCSQDMDNSVMFTRIVTFKEKKATLDARVTEIVLEIAKIEGWLNSWDAYSKKVQEWEKYHALVDPSLANVPLDKATLEKEIASYKASISTCEEALSAIRKRNKTASEHNAKVKVISEQLVDMRSDLAVLTEEVKLHMSELSTLQILVKAFSNTGLIAYKIECMVKDLEELTNEYLGILAGGRFQLSFKVVSDKLNVVITDNGRDISIEALSSGERARVNVSTLLAIRKLMQALSNSRTNLLILDETIEALDAEGKEKLIEVLLEEDSLNVFLVSHGFTHPLLEKVNVVKEHNISRLE